MKNKIENSEEVLVELVELGFKGKLLRDLQAIILTDSDVEDFKNFIILNDEKLKSKLQIVHQYKKQLRERQECYSNFFVSEYENSKTKEDKRKVLEKATKNHVSMQMLDKLESYMESETLNISQFCDIINKYGMDYNLETLLNIVESSNGSKSILASLFSRATSLSMNLFLIGCSAKVISSVSKAVELFA